MVKATMIGHVESIDTSGNYENSFVVTDEGMPDTKFVNHVKFLVSSKKTELMDTFKVGDKVYLRRNNTTPYEILYKTETHIVIMLEGSTEPQARANNTFLINGPVYQPRAEKSKMEEAEEA